MGHSKTVEDNIYVHPEWRAGSFGGNAGMCVQDVGNSNQAMWGEEWSGNTCIFAGSSAHPGPPKIGDFGASPHKLTAKANKYLVPEGTNVSLDFGGTSSLVTLAQAQAAGTDTGSTVGPTPSDEAIVAMGKALLAPY
jgi:hypothetical protein